MNDFLKGMLYAFVACAVLLFVWVGVQRDMAKDSEKREWLSRDSCLANCANVSYFHRTAMISTLCNQRCSSHTGDCYEDCRQEWIRERNYTACCLCEYHNGSGERLQLNFSWDLPWPQRPCHGGN